MCVLARGFAKKTGYLVITVAVLGSGAFFLLRDHLVLKSCKKYGVCSVAAVREFPQGIDVRVRGVVTYYDAALKQMYVQDATEAIRVQMPDGPAGLRTGSSVLLIGKTAGLGFEIRASRVRLTGVAELPSARPSSIVDIPQHHHQRIELHGIVRDVSSQPGIATMVVADEGREITAIVPGKVSSESLLDSTVTLRGVGESTPDGSGGTSSRLLIADSSALTLSLIHI